jgi:hypothetical protein
MAFRAVCLIRIEARMSSWLTGPRVISFWARSRPMELAVQVQGNGFPQIGGVASYQHIPLDLQKQFGQALAISRFVALTVQLHTAAFRHLAPLTVPEQGIENFRTLNQSALPGREQFVEDLVRSPTAHASSTVGMLRVVFGDPLPRRAEELAGQG